MDIQPMSGIHPIEAVASVAKAPRGETGGEKGTDSGH